MEAMEMKFNLIVIFLIIGVHEIVSEEEKEKTTKQEEYPTEPPRNMDQAFKTYDPKEDLKLVKEANKKKPASGMGPSLSNPILQGILEAQGINGPPMSGQTPYSGAPPGLEQFLTAQRIGAETYFEPYWKDGESVFKRLPFISRKPEYLKTYSKLPKYHIDRCLDICPVIYEGYGPICARHTSRVDGYSYTNAYQNFCHMMFDNCVQAETRHRNNAVSRMLPMLEGNCLLRFKLQRHRTNNIMKDTMQFLKAINNTDATVQLPKVKIPSG